MNGSTFPRLHLEEQISIQLSSYLSGDSNWEINVELCICCCFQVPKMVMTSLRVTIELFEDQQSGRILCHKDITICHVSREDENKFPRSFLFQSQIEGMKEMMVAEAWHLAAIASE